MRCYWSRVLERLLKNSPPSALSINTKPPGSGTGVGSKKLLNAIPYSSGKSSCKKCLPGVVPRLPLESPLGSPITLIIKSVNCSSIKGNWEIGKVPPGFVATKCFLASLGCPVPSATANSPTRLPLESPLGSPITLIIKSVNCSSIKGNWEIGKVPPGFVATKCFLASLEKIERIQKKRRSSINIRDWTHKGFQQRYRAYSLAIGIGPVHCNRATDVVHH